MSQTSELPSTSGNTASYESEQGKRPQKSNFNSNHSDAAKKVGPESTLQPTKVTKEQDGEIDVHVRRAKYQEQYLKERGRPRRYNSSDTVAYYYDGNSSRLWNLLPSEPLSNTELSSLSGILFIENINPTWVAAVGVTYNIRHSFFVDHFSSSAQTQNDPPTISLSPWQTHAHAYGQEGQPFTLTCCKLRGSVGSPDCLYLFLSSEPSSPTYFLSDVTTMNSVWLDFDLAGPTNRSESNNQIQVRVPQFEERFSFGKGAFRKDGGIMIIARKAFVSGNQQTSAGSRGGGAMFQVVQALLKSFNGYSNLAFLDWSANDGRGVAELSTLLAVATWKATLDAVDESTQDIVYTRMNAPTTTTFQELANLRRWIYATRKGVEAIGQKKLEQSIADYDKRVKKWKEDFDESELRLVQKRLYDIGGLQKRTTAELDNTAQLLIGVSTVRDSAFMKTQADRATTLTILAAIYLPLTLVTGIFGMNIAEINGGSPAWWAVLVALVVIAVVTGIVFALYLRLRDLRRSTEEKAGAIEWMV